MKQTIKLSLIYFKEQIYNLFKGFSKKAKAKSLPIILLLFLLITFSIGYSLYNIAESLSMLGMSQNIIIIGLFMAFFMSLMITLTDTQGVMYNSKDYDMLMSLPLKNLTIITAKYVGSYLTSMLYYSVIALPTLVVYFIFNNFTALALIFGFLSVLFMPAFSQFLTSVLGFLVNAISSKMKNKNIFRSIFSLICAVGLAVMISLSNSSIFENLFSTGFPLWFKIVFSNIYFLFMAITTSSFINFIYAFLVCLLFIILGITVILIGYKKINTALMITKVKGKPAPIVYKESNTYKMLLKKEFSTVFNSPVYCVNCLVGCIMCIVSTIVTLVVFSQFEYDPIVADIFCGIMAFCVAMCLGIAPSTSVSVSMEGSKLQILKSLPIKFKSIVLSKCSTNLILSIPSIIISVLIFGIVAKISFLTIMLIFVYLLLASFCHTMLGLLLNLKFPRLNWSSETQAVKNGVSMLLTMILDMLISIVPMIIFLVWYSHCDYLTFTIFIPIIIALQLIYAISLMLILNKKGEQIFNNISI